MRRRLEIVDGVSPDTVKCLTEMLDQAKAGEIIGIVAGAIHKRRHYSVNVSGEAMSDPTFARGIVSVLSDRLGDIIQGDS